MFRIYTQKDVDRIVTEKLTEMDKEHNMREMFDREFRLVHERCDYLEKRIVRMEEALNSRDTK